MGELLYMETIQAKGFSEVIEALKEIIVEVNFECTPSGIKLIATDSSQCQLIKLKLYAEKMDTYRCNVDKLLLGIDTSNFYKLIRGVGTNDVIILSYDTVDTSSLRIQIHNSNEEMRKDFSLKLMDIDEQNIHDLDVSKFNTDIIMSSTKFKSICKEIITISDTVELLYTDEQLLFNCNGPFASANYKINLKNDGDNKTIIVDTKNKDEIFQGSYSLVSLCQFTKCIKLCPVIHIYLDNSKPLTIMYKTADLGEMYLALAPLS